MSIKVCPQCHFEQPEDIYCAQCGFRLEGYTPKKPLINMQFMPLFLCGALSALVFLGILHKISSAPPKTLSLNQKAELHLRSIEPSPSLTQAQKNQPQKAPAQKNQPQKIDQKRNTSTSPTRALASATASPQKSKPLANPNKATNALAENTKATPTVAPKTAASGAAVPIKPEQAQFQTIKQVQIRWLEITNAQSRMFWSYIETAREILTRGARAYGFNSTALATRGRLLGSIVEASLQRGKDLRLRFLQGGEQHGAGGAHANGGAAYGIFLNISSSTNKKALNIALSANLYSPNLNQGVKKIVHIPLDLTQVNTLWVEDFMPILPPVAAEHTLSGPLQILKSADFVQQKSDLVLLMQIH